MANSSERNTPDGRFPARPPGAFQIRHCGVVALEKGTTLPCGPRLALANLESSVAANIMLTMYQAISRKGSRRP